MAKKVREELSRKDKLIGIADVIGLPVECVNSSDCLAGKYLLTTSGLCLEFHGTAWLKDGCIAYARIGNLGVLLLSDGTQEKESTFGGLILADTPLCLSIGQAATEKDTVDDFFWTTVNFLRDNPASPLFVFKKEASEESWTQVLLSQEPCKN